MKHAILLVLFALLVPFVVYAILMSPVAPLWLLVPVLVFTAVNGTILVALRWTPFALVALFRMLFVACTLAVMTLALVALASLPTQWLVWPILLAAVAALVIGMPTPGDSFGPSQPRRRAA